MRNTRPELGNQYWSRHISSLKTCEDLWRLDKDLLSLNQVIDDTWKVSTIALLLTKVEFWEDFINH